MLKIYYLSSEIKPFSESGILASFSREFSTIIKNDKDVDIRLIQPKYGFISDRRYILREVIRLKNLSIEFLDKNHSINIKSGFIPGTKVQIYFMEHSKYFHASGELIYKSRNGRVYSNNNERFTFFIKAAIETLEKLHWIPDYIICSNWPMSMAATIVKNLYEDKFKNTKIIYMIHEMNDLFKFDNSLYERLGIDFNKKDKLQDNLINCIQLSDYVYIFNNDNNLCKSYINKHIKIKKLLKNNKHEIIDYSDSMDTSDRIEIYNNILAKLKKI